jgi:peptidoglycan/LPS O-acetylase OafA/YrhL
MWRNWFRLESDKFINTDLLRFVASAGVVIFHLYPYFDPALVRSDALERITHGFNLFVDVFFVVSGIIMQSLYGTRISTIRHYGDFLRKRIARLVPLHYATFAFFAAIAVAAPLLGVAINRQNYDVGCIAPTLLMIHAWGLCPSLAFNAPSWSVSAEMGAYLLVPAIFMVARRSFGPWLVILALFWLASLLPGGRVDTRTFDFGVLRALPAFVFGVWLAAHLPARLASVLARMPLSLACILFALCPLVTTAPMAQLVMAYLLATVAFSRDLNGAVAAPTRRWAPLGRLTYSVYMLQSPVFLVVSLLGERILHLRGALLSVAALMAVGILLPALAILSLQLFETPARRALSGPRARREPAIAAEVAP